MTPLSLSRVTLAGVLASGIALGLGSAVSSAAATATCRTGARAGDGLCIRVDARVTSVALVGNRIAWTDADYSATSCQGHVWTQSLATGVRTQLDATKPSRCPESSPPEGLAFDGSRALWAYEHAFTTELWQDFYSASVSRTGARRVAQGLYFRDSGTPDQTLVTAGARGKLVYFADCYFDGCPRTRPTLWRVTASGKAPLLRAGSVDKLAVSSDTLAVVYRGVEHPSVGGILSPAWSPDGTMIAFSHGHSVYTVAADGTGVRPLASIDLPAGSFEWSLEWSPDGSRLAVVTRDPTGANSRIYLLDIATGAISGLGEGLSVSWAPDSSSLALIRSGGEIRLLDPSTGTSRPLALLPSDAADLSWSPDGGTLAVATVDGVYTVSRDGREREIHSDENGPYSVDWSRQTDAILVTTVEMDQNGDVTSVIASMHPDGSGYHDLVADKSGDFVSASWAPDGRRFVFADYAEGVIYLADADGSDRKPLFPATGRATFMQLYDLASSRHLGTVSLVGARVRAVTLTTQVATLLVADGTQQRFETFDPRTGDARRSVPAPDGVSAFAASGTTVVFAAGRTINALDTRSGVIRAIVEAATTPVALSMSGRRVIWAEASTRKSVIRVLTLRATRSATRSASR